MGVFCSSPPLLSAHPTAGIRAPLVCLGVWTLPRRASLVDVCAAPSCPPLPSPCVQTVGCRHAAHTAWVVGRIQLPCPPRPGPCCPLWGLGVGERKATTPSGHAGSLQSWKCCLAQVNGAAAGCQACWAEGPLIATHLAEPRWGAARGTPGAAAPLRAATSSAHGRARACVLAAGRTRLPVRLGRDTVFVVKETQPQAAADQTEPPGPAPGGGGA